MLLSHDFIEGFGPHSAGQRSFFPAVFKFVYMVHYIDEFSYVEPSLYFWDEAYMTLLDDLFDMFLGSG